MKVVILCGGLGTRLREETEYRPKPMVEVGGRPIVWHIMKMYAQHGFREFVLCLGYKGNMIKHYFLNYQAFNTDFTICLGRRVIEPHNGGHSEKDFEVTLADTGQSTMTGGRVKRIKKYIPDGEPFVVTYGDGLSDVDLRAVLAFHRSHGKLATVTAVRPVSRFGVLELSEGGLVDRFYEKPKSDGWISAGFFVFEPGIFDYLDDDACVLEKAPLEALAREGQLAAYRHEGFFFAMDTFREYQILNELWAGGNAPWKTWA